MFLKPHTTATATIILKEEDHTIIVAELERHNSQMRVCSYKFTTKQLS